MICLEEQGSKFFSPFEWGAGQIQFFSDRLRDMGGIMGKTASDEFSNFNDRMDDLNRILRAKVAGALVVVLPAITALAENFDHLAKFVGIVATAFITAKLPVLIGAVTTAIGALTVAISTNPLGLLAVGVTSAGAALLYKDDIAEYFGFADEAEKLEKD